MRQRSGRRGSGLRAGAFRLLRSATGLRRPPRSARGRRLHSIPVVLLAVALLAVALAMPEAGTATPEGCEWQPHEVRVVKHVKRHGERVKVIRHRLRWSCVPLPAPTTVPSAPVATPPASTPLPPGTPPPAGPPPVIPPPVEETGDAHYVGARAYENGAEYGFEPTGAGFEVRAGKDTIELVNGGQDDHDLHLEKVGSGDLLALETTRPGDSKKATVELEAGTYKIYCSLPTHRSKHGMERTLVVVP